MEKAHFHHALKVINDLCIGCTHCMEVCPTEAVRVRNGKALIIANRCVDCGECMKACPSAAIIVEQDDFNKIFDYKYRVALVPAVFIGQFSEEIPTKQIFSILMDQGFTHVFEVEHGVEILVEATNNLLQEKEVVKPLISSFCPAIVRLIQVKFPSLVENLVLKRQPFEISALYLRKKLVQEGVNPNDIGIFYITPCAAKIAAVKSPVGEETSPIDGVINCNFIFNKAFRAIKQHKSEVCTLPNNTILSGKALTFTLTHGESTSINGKSYAIDEIHNVIEFLEKIENEEATNIDFLELRACDESCAGGVLTTANRFLTVERLNKRAETGDINPENNQHNGMTDYFDFLQSNLTIGAIYPRSMLKLDEKMSEAMKKMSKVHDLIKCLPQVDCRLCGTPSCATLAEDIVQGNAELMQCVFIQKTLEKKGLIDLDESIKIVGQIWGNNKLDINCKQNG
jgi:iron only hydrogenase large subunit-like protein